MLKEKMRNYWNEISPDYRMQYHDHIDEEIGMMKMLFAEYLPDSKLTVLDIGTGLGIQAITFAELGHEVTALDFSNEMLQRAKKQAESRNVSIHFVQGDAENLPFEESSFDIIINMHLLWTLTDHEKFLKECGRVLKNGGRIFSVDGRWYLPDNPNPGEKPADFIKELPLYCSNTPEKVAELFENNGLRNVFWKYLPEYADYMLKHDRNGYKNNYHAVPYFVTAEKK